MTASALIAGSAVLLADVPAAHADTRSVTLVAPGTVVYGSPTFNAVAGDAVIFSSSEALTADDLDTDVDIYRRDGDTIRLMTPGTDRTVVFEAVSMDGSTLVVSTDEAFSPADTDNDTDMYRLTGTTWTPLTPMGSGRLAPIRLEAASADGRRVVLSSNADLTGDVISSGGDDDLYLSDGTIRLLTPGADGDNRYVGSSSDLSRVFFTTSSQVVPADGNNYSDIYVSAAGTVSLVSDGVGDGDEFVGSSTDGTRAYTISRDPHPELGDDTRIVSPDVFVRAGTGPLQLVSVGAQDSVRFGGTSADGTVAYFTTMTSLVASDTNSATDVYRRGADGQLDVMTGGASWSGTSVPKSVSADGSTLVVLTNNDYPSVGDQDHADDLYRVTWPDVGTKKLLSGSGERPVEFEATSPSTNDGRVFFSTADALATTESDGTPDIYVNENGGVALVSDGTRPERAYFLGASPDGTSAYYETFAQIVAADTDDLLDIYRSTSTGRATPTSPPATPTSPSSSSSVPTSPVSTSAPTVGAPSTPAPAIDTTAPTGAVTGPSTQRAARSLRLVLSCGTTEACTFSGTARVVVKDPKDGATRRSSALPVTTVAAGAQTTVKLKLPRKLRAAVRTARSHGGDARASFEISVADSAGNVRAPTFRITLR